jgi:hypothetical protein
MDELAVIAVPRFIALPKPDVSHQSRVPGRLLPALETLVESFSAFAAGLAHRGPYFQACGAQLAGKVHAKPGQRQVQIRLHLRTGRITHLSAPAILQHGQQGQHAGERGDGGPPEDTFFKSRFHFSLVRVDPNLLLAKFMT